MEESYVSEGFVKLGKIIAKAVKEYISCNDAVKLAEWIRDQQGESDENHRIVIFSMLKMIDVIMEAFKRTEPETREWEAPDQAQLRQNEFWCTYGALMCRDRHLFPQTLRNAFGDSLDNETWAHLEFWIRGHEGPETDIVFHTLLILATMRRDVEAKTIIFLL